MTNNDKLIFGNNQLQRIVAVEPNDEQCEVFIENKDGTVESIYLPNHYWILSHEKIGTDWKPLRGDLHFKYGKKYKNRLTFEKDRFLLKNKDTFSVWDSKESFLIRSGVTLYKGMQINDVSLLAFDLETTGLNPDKDDAKILLISYHYRDANNQFSGILSYSDYNNQAELIEAFNNIIQDYNPSILTGHNIYCFDIPYLIKIAENNNVTLKWGRDGSNLVKQKFASRFRIDGSRDQEYNKVFCYGREIVDTYFSVIRWDLGKQCVSYGLKQVIKDLGLEDKNRVFYDASTIRHNYNNPEEWEKIKQYCIHDSKDVVNLYDKIMPTFFYSAQYTPKSFSNFMLSAAGSQINSILIRAYIQDGHSIPKGDVIPPKSIRGGISFGLPGIYRNSWKLDIKSCYPNAILINNLYSRRKDPEGYMFKLCQYFTAKRLEYKKLAKETGNPYYEALDATAKVFINSLFGFCSAGGLNFNDKDVAAAITAYGRQYLGMGMKWATGLDETYWEQYCNNHDES